MKKLLFLFSAFVLLMFTACDNHTSKVTTPDNYVASQDILFVETIACAPDGTFTQMYPIVSYGDYEYVLNQDHKVVAKYNMDNETAAILIFGMCLGALVVVFILGISGTFE